MQTEGLIEKIMLDLSGIPEETLLIVKNTLKKYLSDGRTDLPVPESLEDDALWAKFCTSKRIAGVQPRTLFNYEKDLCELKAFTGKTYLNITTDDIRTFLDHETARGINPSTVSGKCSAFRSFYKFIHDEGYIRMNPTARVERIKLPKVKRKALTNEEVCKLREVCTPKERAIIELLLATGLRATEISNVKVRDVLNESNEFYIIGKGNKERNVYYDDTAKYYVRKYLEIRAKNQGVSSIEDMADEWLFPTKNFGGVYGQYNRKTIGDLIRKIGKRANLRGVHTHKFRRTYASIQIKRGVTLEHLQVLMGHDNINTTIRYLDMDNFSVKNDYMRHAG